MLVTLTCYDFFVLLSLRSRNENVQFQSKIQSSKSLYRRDFIHRIGGLM